MDLRLEAATCPECGSTGFLAWRVGDTLRGMIFAGDDGGEKRPDPCDNCGGKSHPPATSPHGGYVAVSACANCGAFICEGPNVP